MSQSLLQGIESAPDLTEQVYQRLLDAICSGELAPGTRLTQEELAASLSVSRQPVLQALRLLKRDGVVIDAGRRGLIVAPSTPGLIGQMLRGARGTRRPRRARAPRPAAQGSIGP